MSLTTVHPIFSTAGHAPLQVAKAKVQAIMLSGRYNCGALTCHWIKNYDGGCKLSSTCKDMIEDLPHILTQCSALITTRNNLFQFAKKYVEVLPDCIRFLILDLCRSENPLHHQFLLDCSSIPSVIQAHQIGGTDVLHHLFYISRTWVYALHRKRLKILGAWKQYGV